MSLHQSSTHSYHPVPHNDDSDEDSWHNSHRRSYHRAPPPPLEGDGSPAAEFSPTSTTSNHSPFNNSSVYYSAEEALSSSNSEEISSSSCSGRFGDYDGDAFADMNVNSPERFVEEEKDEVGNTYLNLSLRSNQSEPLPSIPEKDAESVSSRNKRKSNRESFQDDADGQESSSSMDSKQKPLIGNIKKHSSKSTTSSMFYLYSGIQCFLLSFIFMVLAIVHRDDGKKTVPKPVERYTMIRIPPDTDQTTRNLDECVTLCSAVSCCYGSPDGCSIIHPEIQCKDYQPSCQTHWESMELPDPMLIRQTCNDLTLVSDWIQCYRRCQPVRCCFDQALECHNTTSTDCNNYPACEQVLEEQAKILAINNGAIPKGREVEQVCGS